MAPRIKADRDASAAGKNRAKANAEKAFKKKDQPKAAANDDGAETLKATVSQLKLPELRDFKHHYNTIMGLKAKVDEANANLRNAYKRADECDVDTQSIKFAMKWSRRDKMELQRHLLSVGRSLEASGSEVQLQLLDTAALDPAEQAFQEGHRDGLAGKHDNRHIEGSSVHARYEDGYARGQGENVAKLKPAVEPMWPDDADVEANKAATEDSLGKVPQPELEAAE